MIMKCNKVLTNKDIETLTKMGILITTLNRGLPEGYDEESLKLFEKREEATK